MDWFNWLLTGAAALLWAFIGVAEFRMWRDRRERRGVCEGCVHYAQLVERLLSSSRPPTGTQWVGDGKDFL